MFSSNDEQSREVPVITDRPGFEANLRAAKEIQRRHRKRVHERVGSLLRCGPRRRTPQARPVARRPAVRRSTNRSGAARGDPSEPSEGDGESDPVVRFRRRLERLGFIRPRDPWRVGWGLSDRPEGRIWAVRTRLGYFKLHARTRAMRLARLLGGLP